jgi:hypothetical protein
MVTDNTVRACDVVKSIQREISPLYFYMYPCFIIVTGFAVAKPNAYRLPFLQFFFFGEVKYLPK